MKYDRNGCNIGSPTTYCWQCSGGAHANMIKRTGKGFSVFLDSIKYGDMMNYRNKCTTCGYITPYREIEYYNQYEIRD